MFKIVDLDIDESITGDTGVFEVAFVEFPAIEQELIFFSKHEEQFESFSDYPDSVSNNAKRGIELNEKEGNKCATQTGKVRAQQLANKEPISVETIKRMYSYLSRAETYYDEGDTSACGTISYLLWGGLSAKRWSESKLKELGQFNIEPNPCWEGYTPYGLKPDGSPNCIPVEQSRDKFDYDITGLPVYDQYPTGTTENDMLIKPQLFVYPSAGESEDEFITRCVKEVMSEGKTQDEALGQCYGMWNQEFSFEKVSFDWDGTLDTKKGVSLLENELRRGNLIYIISARNIPSSDMINLSRKYRIPGSHIFTTGSNKSKIEKIQDLGIVRHYDDNPDVLSELGSVGQRFESLPPVTDYTPSSGVPYTPPTPPVSNTMMSKDCGCPTRQKFDMIGYMDGLPIFTTPQEAEQYGETELGCSGHHTHEDENGNVVYMSCDVHPQEMGTEVNLPVKDVDIKTIGGQENIEVDFSKEYWDEEDLKLKEYFDFIRETKPEEFEAITNKALRGFTESEIKKMNHKKPTTYYLYERIDSGEPHRDFCTSIEGRYFRISQIYALENTNTKFGHGEGGAPYSKWLYKGGPNCIHAWHKYTFLQKEKTDNGMVPGKPGTPPKQMPNNGYYSARTKRRSEMSKIEEQIFRKDDDKRMVYTPLMIPNILIPRMDDVTNERYYVRFRPEVIEKIRNKFMLEQRLRETNYEHTDKKFTDIVMVESWIVESENDKSYSLGFTNEQIPIGTWMGGFKVLDSNEGDEIWNDLIKPGRVRGASVEGNFILNFSRQKDDEYLLKEIINILKTVI